MNVTNSTDRTLWIPALPSVAALMLSTACAAQSSDRTTPKREKSYEKPPRGKLEFALGCIHPKQPPCSSLPVARIRVHLQCHRIFTCLWVMNWVMPCTECGTKLARPGSAFRPQIKVDPARIKVRWAPPASPRP